MIATLAPNASQVSIDSPRTVTVEVNLVSADGFYTDARKILGQLSIRQTNALTVELDAECGADILAGAEGSDALTFAEITAGLDGLRGYAPADLDINWVYDQLLSCVHESDNSPASTVRFILP